MTIEDASAKKLAAGLFRQLPKDATAQLWQDGINFVMKQAGKDRLVGSGATEGGEGSVGGEDGDSGGRVAYGDLGGGEGCVGGEGSGGRGDLGVGEREHAAAVGTEGDRDARLKGGGEEAGQGGEAGGT